MAIQNDNTLVTKGDLKELYTDKIAPYLGGGISYYHTERKGQELRYADAKLASDWTAVAETAIPFINKSLSTINQPSNGRWTIPAGVTVEVIFSIGLNGNVQEPNAEWAVREVGSSVDIVRVDPFDGKTYVGWALNSTASGIYTNTSDTDKVIEALCLSVQKSGTQVYATTSEITIKEIGRIVDPVKVIKNSKDLEETPVGNVISYMGKSVPKHHLACDGHEYTIGLYPELEAWIIEEFGAINYFGGDGSSTWAVPDLRGEFLRGAGTNSHTNQGNGSEIGEHQDATEHWNFRVEDNGNNIYSSWASDEFVHNKDTEYGGNGSIRQAGRGSTLGIADKLYYTSRPTNTSVNYCIKYESTYHVIAPSHAYKVSITGSLDTNGDLINYTIENGEINLVNADKNRFVVPVDGWYAISYNSGQINPNGAKFIQYIEIYRNGTRIKQVVNANGSGGITYFGANTTANVYLQKGDTVGFRVWSQGLSVAWPSVFGTFCLITSNVHENIIAGGEVYSTEEQVIGTWTDGKPIYQKTIEWGALANGTHTKDASSLHIDNLLEAKGFIKRSTSEILVIPNYYMLTNQGVNWINLYNNNISILIQGFTNITNCYTTIKYTKTTDQVNTYTYKNSLLLTRPDLWEYNTEYDFGGGLYGKRMADTTLNVAAKSHVDIVLEGSATAIVAYGGTYGNTGAQTTVGSSFTDSNDTLCMNASVYKASTGGIKLRLANISWSNNITQYDVWATYRK